MEQGKKQYEFYKKLKNGFQEKQKEYQQKYYFHYQYPSKPLIQLILRSIKVLHTNQKEQEQLIDKIPLKEIKKDVLLFYVNEILLPKL